MLGAMGFVVCCVGDPYKHTNPYDPAFPVAITISGPDTLFSYGELAQYGVQIVPAFPDSALQWKIDDTVTIHRGGNLDTIIGGETFANPGAGDTVVTGDTLLSSLGNGLFQSTAPLLYPKTFTVTVEALLGAVDTNIAIYDVGIVFTPIWRHTGYKSVVVTQRVTRIQLRCPDTHACDTVQAGGTWSVWVDGFDALGHQIVALTGTTANPVSRPLLPQIATFVSRDTTIAAVTPIHIRAATVTALKTGTTWIVAARDSLRDSLQLVVR